MLLTCAKSIGEYEPSEVIREPTSGKIIHLNGTHTITITHDDSTSDGDAVSTDDEGDFCIEDDDEDCSEEDDLDEEESDDCDCDHGGSNHTSKDHRVINDVDQRKTLHPGPVSVENRKNLSKW